MIEHTTVNGRPATVAYLKGEFEPCTQAEAELVKVIFEDERGGVMFLTPVKEGTPDAAT